MTDTEHITDTAAQLRKAADLIRERGHSIGTYENSDGQLCLQGALLLAHGRRSLSETETGVTEDAMQALYALLPSTCSEHGQAALDMKTIEGERVWHWNDWHCDGGPEAILVLEQAAEKLEAEL